ncbi:hypothetical protein NKI04_34680 [Mesorhizobium sp. M0814]|uniref:hypothetical protein n=1 Tax=Mesorhizobium sp. M0814 TaxID=2957004 RepID=UPI003336FF89
MSSDAFQPHPLLLEHGLDIAGVVTVLAVIGPAHVAGRLLVIGFGADAPVHKIDSAIVVVFPAALAEFAWAPASVLLISASRDATARPTISSPIIRGFMVPEICARSQGR